MTDAVKPVEIAPGTDAKDVLVTAALPTPAAKKTVAAKPKPTAAKSARPAPAKAPAVGKATATKSAAAAPKKAQGTTQDVPVVWAKTTSETWTKTRFREVLRGPAKHPMLQLIRERRTMLSHLAPRQLHRSYDPETTKDLGGLVNPKQISIPPRYGEILYKLALQSKTDLTVEAGAGFGISTMYLGLAAKVNNTSLLSFEIADYADIAQKSLDIITPAGIVKNESFDSFPIHLNGSTSIGFAFIDAKHDADNILRSYKSLVGWLAPKSMIVIDDIWYSDSSRGAWQEIVRTGPFGFAALVNKRFGVLAP
ncbi:hypothetical protein JANAI62_18650 [Jannaschia pagri]|uniref:Methyltransferase domain-containing protein n=1 Tax=Jannaschia pagri TaxID=2829797 RepID=A0ABQ4NLF2_9RHOB|nr:MULTISPECIES: class I SAM-dependent methyltransferase [unclassified Jannaschia]GIT91408.1 hypothetical protein JANAI61_18660 [Jannaschia sp. AI_61]GIT95242.1 hypothetical protein JANAI62_18650 [Jannaschia sp. AI_62]